jgi:hypothetical protein
MQPQKTLPAAWVVSGGILGYAGRAALGKGGRAKEDFKG